MGDLRVLNEPGATQAIRDCTSDGWYAQVRLQAPIWAGYLPHDPVIQTDLWACRPLLTVPDEIRQLALLALWGFSEWKEDPDLVPELGHAPAFDALKRYQGLLFGSRARLALSFKARDRRTISKLLLELADEAGMMGAPRRRGVPKRLRAESLAVLLPQTKFLIGAYDEWCQEHLKRFSAKYNLSESDALKVRFPLLSDQECEALRTPNYEKATTRTYSRADHLIATRLGFSPQRVRARAREQVAALPAPAMEGGDELEESASPNPLGKLVDMAEERSLGAKRWSETIAALEARMEAGTEPTTPPPSTD